MEAKNATAASWSHGEDNVATHFERLTRPGRSNTAPDTSATRRSVTPTNREGRGGWFVGGSCDGAEVTSPEVVALESAVEPRRCDAVATRAAGRTAEGSEARRRTDEEARCVKAGARCGALWQQPREAAARTARCAARLGACLYSRGPKVGRVTALGFSAALVCGSSAASAQQTGGNQVLRARVARFEHNRFD